ncbi:MAG: hypothetical protein SVP26_01795 [Chloroflexota bacterium]|nr:hypothetical protein [Chloroflexota bacterium]
MAQKTKVKRKEGDLTLEQLQGRLDVLDQRLDDLDSMVTAIAERVMRRPISIVLTCPNCGKTIDIALVGNEKMLR